MNRWRRRQLKDYTAKVLATLATLFGLFWLTWILWTTVSKGLPRIEVGTLHPDDAAAGLRRGPAQCVRRQPHHVCSCRF